MSTLAADRRFFTHIREWRVGQPTAYSYVGESSGIGPVSWQLSDPILIIPIPAGASPVRQMIGNPKFLEGWFDICDFEAVTVLLRETDVTGSTEYAVTSTDRNECGYFAFLINNTRIANVTDARTATISTFTFANTLIHYIQQQFTEMGPANKWRIFFSANGVSQVDT